MKIINCSTLGEMCEFLLDGEPCFVIRAQDKLAVGAVEAYIELARSNGGLNTIRAVDHMQRMRDWQSDNPKRVKTPD